MKTKETVTAKEILTLEEAAEFLDISEKALREAAARSEVPARKIARQWRFSRFALHRWLSRAENAHPYLRHAGTLADNPLWEEVRAAIESERKAQRSSSEKQLAAQR